jgi:hypothetical protein
MSTDLRYPIGRYEAPSGITSDTRAEWIREIERLPENLSRAVSGLNDAQLDTQYRPGGWTVRQVVHHYADSHMNSYLRFRWAVTEDVPAIKVYNEADWAKLADAKTAPIELSLTLLEALHARWALLLRSFGDREYARTVRHPEWGEIRVDWLIGQYAWHSRHHVAQITRLRERQGW